MAQKPLLLMDIDGVLNILGWTKEETIEKGLTKATALGYTLWLHPEHPEWIAELEEHFEIIWATMWTDRAHIFGEVAGGIGVDWDYIDFHQHQQTANRNLRTGDGVVGYKFPGVQAVTGDRPFVYIDDDMSPEHHDWAMERTASGIPTLFLQPREWVGMTRTHVDLAIAFAKMLAADEGKVSA